jgi:hypothetical protein
MTIEVVPCTQPGCVDLRDVHYPDDGVLHLTTAEWVEFLAAAKRGDFDVLARLGASTPGAPAGRAREPPRSIGSTESPA